jgi:hypothetical protein
MNFSSLAASPGNHSKGMTRKQSTSFSIIESS